MPTPYPSELLAAYGKAPVAPLCRLRFTLPGADPVLVTPTDGRLRWDASRWPRCTLTADMPTTITPQLLPDAVSAYGGRVTVTLGATIRGVPYTFTAATLAVNATNVRRPDAAVTVEAVSLEALVNEDRADTETPTPAGTVSSVVSWIVKRTLPTVAVVNSLGALDTTLARGAYTLDGDVWPTVEAIMDAAGAEAWFDADGRLVLRPVPVNAATPDLTIAAGFRGALTGYDSDRRWGHNRVALVWESADATARNLRYKWTAARTATPASGRVSVNTADPVNATALYVHRTALGGQDVSESFAGLTSGDRVAVVQDVAGGPDKRLRYVATGPATIGASIISIPVDLTESAGSEPADAADVDVNVRIKAHRRVGVWEDTRAGSLTRVSGPYGRHTYRETYTVDRGTLPSQAQADAAALAMARRVVGRFRTVRARGIPAGWLLPGDTVALGMLGGLTERHLLQAVELPLPGLDVMTVTTRESAYTGGPF